jgi:uridine kinase
MTRTRLDLLNNLIYRIEQSRQSYKTPYKVAIDGLDGAGKTFLANELYDLMKKNNIPAITSSIDRFHNKKKIRYNLGESSPEGYYKDSFNYDLLLENLLTPLMRSEDIMVRSSGFDLKSDEPVEEGPSNITPDTVLIFDGIFLGRPRLQKFWDLHIFIHTDFENILPRVINRDSGHEDEIRERYLQKYIPGQILYLDECRPHLQADILINNNNYDHPYFIVNSREKELFLQHTANFFKRYNKEI